VSAAATLRRTLSRLAALGLVLVLAVVLHAGLVVPYREAWQRSHDLIEQQAALLARYRELASRSAEPDGQADRERLALLQAGLLPRQTEGQAVAGLQDRIKTIGGAAGINLSSVQALPPHEAARKDEAGGLIRLGLRLRLAGDVASLNRFLYEIEAHRPFLVVENLAINGRGARPGAPSPLDIQLDVIGLQAKEAL